MIRFGVVLSVVLIAIGLLATGAVAGSLLLVVISIGVALLAFLMLIGVVISFRHEIFGRAARERPGFQAAMPAVAGEAIPAGMPAGAQPEPAMSAAPAGGGRIAGHGERAAARNGAPEVRPADATEVPAEADRPRRRGGDRAPGRPATAQPASAAAGPAAEGTRIAEAAASEAETARSKASAAPAAKGATPHDLVKPQGSDRARLAAEPGAARQGRPGTEPPGERANADRPRAAQSGAEPTRAELARAELARADAGQG